ncbi:CHAT domain-containing tetratricopeptide repeat protein [Hymenobacter translucens]|uniref:CHAT domain-containing tetratricopeptide repeat protein n=1 Tax=Hymenobacter translucens TaxID=2886507 RepID=UPI001D0E9207|nr:CHAT domain-containing protein [Hymenobacter translucens]
MKVPNISVRFLVLIFLMGTEARLSLGQAGATIASLNQEAKRLYQAGQYEQGVLVGQKAVALAKQKLGEQHPNYATSLCNLALLYESTGRYAKAELLYQNALAINKKQLGERHPHYTASLNNLASLNKLMGRYARAEPLYLAALATNKQELGEQHPGYAVSLNNLASLYTAMGRYAEAEALYQKAIAIEKQQLGEQHPSYANSLHNLASLYTAMGRYAETESLYQKAIAIEKQQLGEQHPSYANSLHNLASFYESMGRHTQAETLYQKAIAISKKRLGEQHPSYANSLNNLANLYESMGRHTQAEPLFQTALTIRKQQLGTQHPDYAASLNSLASLYMSIGRYAQAEPLYQKALAIERQQLGEYHPDYANSLDNLGSLYKLMRRYTQAESLLQKALTIRKQQLGEQHPDYANSLNNLAELYECMGRHIQAGALNAQAVTILLQHVRVTFPGLSERERQQFLITISLTAEFGQSVLSKIGFNNAFPATATTAYNTLLFTKGLLLAATAGMQHQILASSDTALTQRFARWQAAKRQLATARSLSLTEQKTHLLDLAQLAEKANQMEKELAAKSATFEKGTSLPIATCQQVQRTLKPGEAAIEMVRYRWFRNTFTDTIYYSAYVLTPRSKTPQLVVLRNANELEGRYLPAYRHLTHSATGTRGAIDANAATANLADPKVLYQAFWQPISRALPPGTKRVYLSADGVYQQINLNTLQNPATGKFLLEELDVRLVGSTRELARKPATGSHPVNEGVLVGNPAYRLSTAMEPMARASASPRGSYNYRESFLKAGEIPPLPGTADEIEELDRLFAAANVPRRRYTQAAATEEAIRDLHRPRVLHIATHGFFVPESRTVSAQNGKKLTEAQTSAAIDPMLRSGLLLAGVTNFRDAKVKPATEDGILTAYEASLLDMQDTELVVLSACETGLGEVLNGEGVYGLQRGFTVAGAKSIMMSLWRVDDLVTKQLMAAFYKNWLSGQTKRAALKAAQLQIKAQHPEPYYWGAFVLVGE